MGQKDKHSLISDEELQKIRVGELKPHNNTITLVEYDPSFSKLYIEYTFVHGIMTGVVGL